MNEIENLKIKKPLVTFLKDKIPFYVFHNKALKLIKFTVVNNFNTFRNEFCINHLTKEMLFEGTKHHNNNQIADIIDFYGTNIDITSTPDSNVFSFTALNEYFDKIFNLFKEIYTEPLFDENRLTFVKNREIQNLKISNTQNKTIAFKQFKKILFGDKHPYGHSLNEQHIKDITEKDIRECFKNFWLNNCQVFITGNIDSEKIDFIKNNFPNNLEYLSTSYENELKDLPLIPQTIELKNGNNQQVSMCIGTHLIDINHEDFQKLWCTVNFLGGYFGSRLMKNIREKKGFTYGINAQIKTYRYSTYLLIKTSAKKEFKDNIYEEIEKEIKKIQEEKINNEELFDFKQYFLGNFLSTFSNSFSYMDHLVSIKMLNIDENYYEDLFTTIKNITEDDIKCMSKKYLLPEKFLKVSV